MCKIINPLSAANFLIIIVGPTAVGKTAFGVRVAQRLNGEVLSADSRQFFREMTVGTAKPTPEEMQGVPHHFIDFLPLEAEMSAGDFEMMALEKLRDLFGKSPVAVMVGGSGLYIKALCEGMSDMPRAPKEIRDQLMTELEQEGLEKLLSELERKDPEYFAQVDPHNHQRVVRALEMIRHTEEPFSRFRTGEKSRRNFEIIKIGLEMDREALYERINQRVDAMLKNGLKEEATRLYPKRHLNALQTVGYQEIFDFLDGQHRWEEAVRLIKRNTRRYAKRQMTWFKRDPDVKWFHPEDFEAVMTYLKSQIGR